MDMLAPGWSFHNRTRVLFGDGRLSDLPACVGDRRVLLVTSPGFSRRGTTRKVQELLGPRLVGIDDAVHPRVGLPDIEALAAAHERGDYQMVVGLGGGMVLDVAKTLSLLIPARETGFSLREHLIDGAPLPDVETLPVVAVPTTAGSGSEVTPFATVWDWDRHKKLSLASPRIQPQIALLDPALTVSLPLEVTIAGGLDAISHAFESTWNRNATPITLMYSTRALALALEVLPKLKQAPQDRALRTAMAEASLLAGLAISNTRTALSHSISYPLTAHYGLPHGLATSFTLPAVLVFNSAVDDGRLSALSRDLGHRSAAALSRSVAIMMRGLGANDLVRDRIASEDDLLRFRSEMITPGRADNNLRALEAGDVERLLHESAKSAGLEVSARGP